jgi:hypothetical protein
MYFDNLTNKITFLFVFFTLKIELYVKLAKFINHFEGAKRS